VQLIEFRQKINAADAEYGLLLRQREELEKRQKKAEEYLTTIEKALAYIQVKAQETQNQLKVKIEDIVQLTIDSCFPNKYKFQLDFTPKRGRTEAELKLTEIENIEQEWNIDPLENCGGGVSDMESLGLRLAAWALKQNENVIILDEPFKNLSEDKKPLAAEIVRELAERLGLQFIIITHEQTLIDIADNEIKFGLRKRKGTRWERTEIKE